MVKTILIVFNVLISVALYAQQIDVNINTSKTANPNFMAGSATMLYSLVQGNFNEELGMYDSTYFGEGAVDLIADLDLTNIRFPGGTLSQFYHFRGENGYGTDPNDLFCRPGYLPLGTFYTKVSSDYLYPKNMIHSYVDLIHLLEQKQNKTIGTHYVVNIMTHYFNGDFFEINPFIDGLIEIYGNDISHLLDTNPAEINEDDIINIVEVLFDVKNDTIIQQLKDYLIEQPSFYAHFTENLEGIQFLIDNDVTIKGIELGNESYAYKMLQDDDLSHIPYDCTTPDSVLQEVSNFFIPVREYMQALIKYGLITEMYDEAIKTLWGFETGVVINGTEYTVNTLDLDEFEINVFHGEKGRFNELWNAYVGNLEFADAVIPHLYQKSLPQCEIYDQLSEDSITTFIRNRINFYFDDVLPWQLNQLTDIVNGKKMWATEWNINGANAFANTFAHGNHAFKFLNNINTIQHKYNIEHINYHLIIAWNFNQFAMLRANRSSSNEYQVNKQFMFEAFDIMSDINNTSTPLAETNFNNWLRTNGDTSTTNYWGYYDDENKIYHLNFINSTENEIEIETNNLIFQISVDSIWQDSMIATSYNTRYVQAESMFSSNAGCRDYPEIHDNYESFTTDMIDLDSENQSTVSLPPYSFGNISFNLAEIIVSSTTQETSHNISVYPNPASNYLQIDLNKAKNVKIAKVYNAIGTLQNSYNMNSSSEKIETKTLVNGIYFLQFYNDRNQMVARKKIVVSHK